MAIPFTKERRLATRQKLTGLMPGKFYLKLTGQGISGRPVDVSDSGLGILSAQELSVDNEVCLFVDNQEIVMKVLWRKPDFGKNNLMRYGLACEDKSINVAAIFVNHGCLK